MGEGTAEKSFGAKGLMPLLAILTAISLARPLIMNSYYTYM